MPPCVFLSVHTCVVCVYTHARRYPHHLSAKSTTSPQKAPPLMTCTFKNAYYLSNHTTSPSKKPTPLTIRAPPLHHRYHLSRHKVLMNSSYIQWLTLAVIGYSGLVPSPIFSGGGKTQSKTIDAIFLGALEALIHIRTDLERL